MTRIIDETWSANRYVLNLGAEPGVGTPIGQFMDDSDNPDPMCDRDRATLAAQAPAMARLLRDMMRSYAGSRSGWCPMCRAEHAVGSADCPIVAVLNAAGVPHAASGSGSTS
jgi:hypothetical protein